jgi:hypothetical protein
LIDGSIIIGKMRILIDDPKRAEFAATSGKKVNKVPGFRISVFAGGEPPSGGDHIGRAIIEGYERGRQGGGLLGALGRRLRDGK